MEVAKMSTKMLLGEKNALQDIAAAGRLSPEDVRYYRALVDEINRRLAAESRAQAR